MTSGDRPHPDVAAVFADAPAAVVSDALDRLGRRDQALDPAIVRSGPRLG